MGSTSTSRTSLHVPTKTFLAQLDINTLTPRRKRSADPDPMGPKTKRARNEKNVDEELSKVKLAKVARRGQTKPTLNETPSQKLDIYVFGSGESGELGLGNLKRNGKAPTNVKRPRLNDLLDAKTVGIVQLDVGGMRKSQQTRFLVNIIVLRWLRTFRCSTICCIQGQLFLSSAEMWDDSSTKSPGQADIRRRT